MRKNRRAGSTAMSEVTWLVKSKSAILLSVVLDLDLQMHLNVDLINKSLFLSGWHCCDRVYNIPFLSNHIRQPLVEKPCILEPSLSLQQLPVVCHFQFVVVLVSLVFLSFDWKHLFSSEHLYLWTCRLISHLRQRIPFGHAPRNRER